MTDDLIDINLRFLVYLQSFSGRLTHLRGARDPQGQPILAPRRVRRDILDTAQDDFRDMIDGRLGRQEFIARYLRLLTAAGY